MTKANKVTFLLLVAALISIATVASVGLTQRRIPSRGVVHVEVLGIEAYWDVDCTDIVTEIDWGVLEPSDVVVKIVYLKNTGNAAVVLSMIAENWAPVEAETYIVVSWDAEGSTLVASAMMSANITLSVATDISGVSDFSLDIVITGGS